MKESLRKIVGDNNKLLTLAQSKVKSERTRLETLVKLIEPQKEIVLQLDKLVVGLTAQSLSDDEIEKTMIKIMHANKAYIEMLMAFVTSEAMYMEALKEVQAKVSILETFDSAIKN